LLGIQINFNLAKQIRLLVEFVAVELVYLGSRVRGPLPFEVAAERPSLVENGMQSQAGSGRRKIRGSRRRPQYAV
jgi:hypothetical protein